MISFALRLEIRRTKTMARPLKETPMLFGEEAKKFEMRMLNPEPVTEERKLVSVRTMSLCVVVASIVHSR